VIAVRNKKIGALSGAAVAAALVLALHPAISSAQGAPTHLDVFNVEGRFEKDIDVGRAGFPTAGDFAVESQPLLDPADGSAAGRSISELTIVRAVSRGQDFEIILHSTLRLSQGDVVLDGGLRFSELFEGGTIAVVGGTGAFAGARGTAAFSSGTVGGRDGFLVSIDITTG
jgi:hypothetical protein